MAINTSLLIAAPMLQDYFVDSVTDEAMSSGVITCYRDNSRTTLKNWYYQSGVAGAYTYIKLPNPLTLTAAGTIADDNGNDTIPFFYPYSETDNQTIEPYYITVDNSDGQRQFTRQNFPFIPENPTDNQVPTLKNLIVNNVFWRPNGTYSQTTGEYSINATSETNIVIAPSQHDSFSMPDIRFIKNVAGANDTITLKPFGLGNDPLSNDITPEYYINHNCSSVQGGETLKVYQFPISLHIKTLESVAASVTIQAQNEGGNVNNEIGLYIYQFLGSGVSSPEPILIRNEFVTLNQNWQKFDLQFIFPSAEGLTLSGCNNDALYLQVSMPLSATCDINFTKPSIFLSETVPTNDFSTYDEIDAIISSPRTGDIRTSLNSFYSFGWVPMNDRTIGNANSGANNRANADTFPLFDLIWSNVPDVWAPVSGGRGASSSADFLANKTITLTKAVGRVFAGTALPANTFFQTFTTNFAVNSNLTVAATEGLYSGSPVYLTTTGTLPAPLNGNTVYYCIPIDSTHIRLATSYANAIARTEITLLSNGTGTHQLDPYILGSYSGQEEHTPTIAEMVSHNHPGSAIGGGLAGSGTFAGQSPTELADLTVSVANQGSSFPFNITQLTTYMNIFIKL